jgi:hypothetical protein
MLVDAAWALVEAINAESSDNRARAILQKLVSANAEMAVQNAWILQSLNGDSQTTSNLPLM